MLVVNKIILIPNITKDKELSFTKDIAYILIELGLTVYLDADYSIDGTVSYTDTPTDAELIIVVGGDGSVIDASGLAVELDVPLLGINLGKVGYLTTLDPDNYNELSKLLIDEFFISEKMLLSVIKTDKNGDKCYSNRLALNDVIVTHDSYLGIADFKIENSRGDSVIYRADGVIISTPSGSTAYSLSAGGPIISHTLDSIMVMPVCPHSFFNRAIIYGPEERIRITNLSDVSLNISVDGRLFSSMANGESCEIVRSNRKIKMLTLGESNLFATLSKKIKLLHDSV
jgi:NAD+ kinase